MLTKESDNPWPINRRSGVLASINRPLRWYQNLARQWYRHLLLSLDARLLLVLVWPSIGLGRGSQLLGELPICLSMVGWLIIFARRCMVLNIRHCLSSVLWLHLRKMSVFLDATVSL